MEKLGKIALSLVNMDVLPEMHDLFPRRYMGLGASLRVAPAPGCVIGKM